MLLLLLLMMFLYRLSPRPCFKRPSCHPGQGRPAAASRHSTLLLLLLLLLLLNTYRLLARPCFKRSLRQFRTRCLHCCQHVCEAPD
jgi:hypothetical protein